MPATGWTTSSSRSSVSRVAAAAAPPRSPRRLRSRNRRPRRPPRPSPSSSSSSPRLLVALLIALLVARRPACPASCPAGSCSGRPFAVGLVGPWSDLSESAPPWRPGRRPACSSRRARRRRGRRRGAHGAAWSAARPPRLTCRSRSALSARRRGTAVVGGVVGGLVGLVVGLRGVGRVADRSRRGCSRMAAMSSLLRMPEAPLTPTALASARSSGSTMVDSEPVRGVRRYVGLGAGSAAGAAIGASAAAEDESSEVTVFGSSLFAVLPPAVMRSVSVTDFLSFPR